MQKLVFFRETRHSFGRTALLLSGGASLAMYHLGVARALFEAGLLPRVVSGSSGGSIVAAWICTATDEEMLTRLLPGAIKMDPFEQLSVGSVRRKVLACCRGASVQQCRFVIVCCVVLIQLSRLWTRGVLFDIKVLERFVHYNIGDVTFLEAYRRTRRVLNITVTSAVDSGGDNSRLLNYLTAPNVLIYTAVLASCAIPGVYEPVELRAKNKLGEVTPYHPQGSHWQDGSIVSDLPTERLSELFNINQFIVSQVSAVVWCFAVSV